MKKITLISTAALAAFALSAPAANAAVSQTLNVKLTSNKAGTKAKPTTVGITVSTGTVGVADSGLKEPVTYAKISLPKGIALNYKAFPACKAADGVGCADSAPKSQVGSGTAKASIAGIDYEPSGTLTPFIGAGGKLFIRTQFSQPAVIDEPLIGKVSLKGGAYSFDFNVPTILQTPLPNQDEQLIDFTVKFDKKTVKKGKKKIGLVDLTSCPKGGYVFTGEFTYKSGATSKPSFTLPCKSAKK